MLLRQLYLSHMESSHFTEALAVAREASALGVLPDAARQDVARASLALGDLESAIVELRLAGREAPASRRAFHLWSLGSLLWLCGREGEAVAVLERAARWGTRDKPLYRAQLLLARLESGESVLPSQLRSSYETLAEADCGHGYGEFVLGVLAFRLGDAPVAAELLGGFVDRVSTGRRALAVGLGAELRRAEELLGQLSRRRS
jgi:tetratricopeptide (TPR) repeat protein